jgi:hypothetical protein
MIKNEIDLQRRRNFAKLAIVDKKKAADKLRDAATGLENCKDISDIIYALNQILFLSERTIERDISS